MAEAVLISIRPEWAEKILFGKKTQEVKNAKVVVGPNFLAHWYIYDFQVCEGRPELLRTMDYINRHGYDLISVTQYQETYTVFFRRRACG